MSDRNTPADLRAHFKKWCSENCCPGGSRSEFYWRLFQAGASAQQRIDFDRRSEHLRSIVPETCRND